MLARGAVVVRSSAIGEDSSGHSFAGQLDSILNVTNEDALERAVLECWASYWSERALFYCARSKIARAGMGVVIQQQVDARAAGVLFTDAGDGSMLVEYAAGLGDALVSGAINPGRLSIARDTKVVRHVARPPHGGDDLLDNAIEALAAAGTKLERELGAPQDIEWALDHSGALFIVQSRPITAPLLPPTRERLVSPVPRRSRGRTPTSMKIFRDRFHRFSIRSRPSATRTTSGIWRARSASRSDGFARWSRRFAKSSACTPRECTTT